MNIFEMATRNGYRFSYKGVINVEDLWQLSVQNLDTIFKELNSKMKQVKEESLLNTKTKADSELEAKIEIVKYIVKVKLEEENVKLKAKEDRAKKQKIMEALASKQEENLQNKSEEELKAMLGEMED